MEWNSTREALSDLEKLLTCGLCGNYLSDPCTLENCDHNFCRKCIEEELGSTSKCPDCGAFSWLKDLRQNHQLSTTVTMMLKLRSLIGSNKEVHLQHDFKSPPVNTIIFHPPDEYLPETSVPREQSVAAEINASSKYIDIDRVLQEKENNPNMKDVTLARVAVKHIGKTNEHAKKNLVRSKLKRQASCFYDNSPDTMGEYVGNDLLANDLESTCLSDTSKELVKPGDTCSRRMLRHRNICSRDNKPTEKHGNKNSPFTRLRPRQKDGEAICISGKAVKKLDAKIRATSALEEKGNATLIVKRRKVRPRNTSIRQYLVEIENPVDSLSEKLAHSSPQEQRFRKSTMNTSVSSSQDLRNKRGETSLHLAAIKGDISSARQLIKEGANPNAKDNAGWTPLHEACNHGHVDIVELFLDNGALLNIPGFDNDTPLHDAVANGRLNVVKLLVERGASLSARNKQGLIPKDYAATQPMKNALSPLGLSESSSKNLPTMSYLTNKSDDYSAEPKVILGTALNKYERERLEKCIRRLGGTSANEFNESVTHVVTSASESGVCPRTIKYFSGILTGKWIVSFKWITDCLRNRKWIKEDIYEVQGTAGMSSNGPKKARFNMAQQLPPLFDGCSFFFRGSFNPPTPEKEDLTSLIKLGGGKILHREPKVKDDDLASLPSSPIVTSLTRPPEVAYHACANSSLSCCTQFIIFDPTFHFNPKIIHSPVLCTAPVTWLMDCISSFELLDIPDNIKTD